MILTLLLTSIYRYISGGSLDQLLRKMKGKMELKDLVVIARGIAAGMLQLEDKRIVHRDLACRNILVERRDSSYLAKACNFLSTTMI
jgi:serine/threonine protein kinase